MRIRRAFAAAFVSLVLISAYIGLAPNPISGRITTSYEQSDKVLHFIDFFLLTLSFYWVVDTNRRRVLHLTLIVCTGVLSVGSEIVQQLIPNNGRDFDIWDIAANIVGSLCAVSLCAWYHKRMVDRKRREKQYHTVPGDDHEEDLELGEASGPQLDGVTGGTDIEQELDNWDENVADEWEEEDPPAVANGSSKDDAIIGVDKNGTHVDDLKRDG